MEILYRLFELLFQGAAAGLIVLAVTRCLQRRQEESLSRKYALLMYVEIGGHIQMLETLINTSNCGRPIPWNAGLNCLYEELSTPYLTVLAIEDLKEISRYYQSAHLLNMYLANNRNSFLEDEALDPLFQTLKKAKNANAFFAARFGFCQDFHKRY